MQAQVNWWMQCPPVPDKPGTGLVGHKLGVVEHLASGTARCDNLTCTGLVEY